MRHASIVDGVTVDDLVRQVAERVMGIVMIPSPFAISIDPYVKLSDGSFLLQSLWHPDTDLNHLWQVVERMRELGYKFFLVDDIYTKKVDEWLGGFRKRKPIYQAGPWDQWVESDKNINIAVLKAALKAVDE